MATKDQSLNGDCGYCWRNDLRSARSLGKYLAAGVTFAHFLERPDALREREAPIYFRLDLFF